MELLGAVGGGAFVLASLVLGLRLLLLGRRTRQLPELSMGAALFLMGGIGYPLVTICRLAPIGPTTIAVLFGTYMVLQWFGITCLAVFNWRVFRPASMTSQIAAFGLSACMLTCSLVQGLGEGFAAAARDPKAAMPQLASYFACVGLGWACAESWRYHRMLRRRMAIGLADALVTDRFRLWALSAASASFLTFVTNIAFLLGIDFRRLASRRPDHRRARPDRGGRNRPRLPSAAVVPAPSRGNRVGLAPCRARGG